MKNKEILITLERIEKMYKETKNLYFPSKISFFIQKNKSILLNSIDEIEKTRMDIIKHYGIQDKIDCNKYNFPTEAVDIVNKELDDLININQNLDFYKIKLSDLEGLEFTLEQMEALMFMIEED